MINSTLVITRSRKVKVKSLSCVQFFVTPWTVAYHAPPSIGFSRQEYWSGLPFPSPTRSRTCWQLTTKGQEGAFLWGHGTISIS